ncbi:MAG: hypothetical protein QSU88_04140, partial [Candidatus Methanoperedens sp.]|nr:hypothetical protein [Candidatus Methanoperedens sp.]
IYAALKSSFVAVFADREAIADGLNPLTISHTARTNSSKPDGATKKTCIGEKGPMMSKIASKHETKCNRIATILQPDNHRGMSFV